ncbi:MAG: transposase [Actinomycetota bacterium]|nr:transposase [Actinomycetota bacterium]
MKQIRDRVGGLDVHRDAVVACTRVQAPTGQVEVQKERFATTQEGLAELTAFLMDAGVTTVAMEAAGVYWRTVVRHEAPGNREEVQGLLWRAVAAAC